MDRKDHIRETMALLSRRQLLQAGAGLAGLSYLGLALPQLLQARSAKPTSRPSDGAPPAIRSCIFIFYFGGPSHLDTWDLKPNAPREIRGEFGSIATTVTGLRIGEHLPRMARVMHKVALIRSMRHAMRNHDSACTTTFTGRAPLRGDTENFSAVSESVAGPGHGALLSHLRRGKRAVLPHAALPFFIRNLFPIPGQAGGFLGAACNPFLIEGDPATLSYHAELLRMQKDLSSERLARRSALLHTLDQRTSRGGSLRSFYDKALRLLGSEEVHRALDIGREPLSVRERYGITWPGLKYPEDNIAPELRPALPLRGQNLLLARRLVEAGVPFVNVYDFKVQGANWDTHAQGFTRLKDYLLPPADQALSALIEDLDQRGLLDSTLVVALGEFGRTPRVNPSGGRDHWPDCYSAVLAGGGIRGGAVHGSSDSIGAFPASDPVTPADLAATIFWRFGLDPATEIFDSVGRPVRLAEGTPLTKIFA
jgi:hypothetical protein